MKKLIEVEYLSKRYVKTRNGMNEIQWFDKARIYHIMVDRFNGGWQTPPPSVNDFCGGTLQGVIDKLDYIKCLGFNTMI